MVLHLCVSNDTYASPSRRSEGNKCLVSTLSGTHSFPLCEPCLTKPISARDLFATVDRVRRELEAGSLLLLAASREEVESPAGIDCNLV